MELKGELKRNGLPALFRNFATEKFQGLLTITSSVGEKLITLTENEVTIYCDELNESSRLGNILMARGLVTEEILDATLRDQKRIEPRPKLGDMLVQRGIVHENAIADARRFQIEEDIADVLSWKKTRFSFADASSAREIHPEDFAFDQVHRMPIDPDSFFKYVTKVTENWDAIGDRLPTQYLCFKLSPKIGDLALMPKESQVILRFLKEGRSVEGTVKQSCIGRIEVCTKVIEFLEKGLVLPASGADLRFMASEHRAHKRLHDAMYIYRRLLESPDAKDERAYLENLIEEIADTIVRSKQSGDYGEEAVIVSHKGARDKYIQSKRNRKIFWMGFGVAAVVVIAIVLIQSNKPAENLPQRYRETISRVDQFVATGKFNDAMKDLDDLLESIPDKESHAAISIQDKKARIPGLLHNYIEDQLPVLNKEAQMGEEARAKAVTLAENLLEEYPQNASEQKLRDFILRYKVARVVTPKIPDKPEGLAVPVAPQVRDGLLDRLRKIDPLIQQKKYLESLREFNAIAQLAPVNGDIWKQADAGIRSIKETEAKINDSVKSAEQAWSEKKGDKALELIDQAIPQFGDFDGLANAESLKTRWAAAKSSAQQIFKTAQELEGKSSFFEAKTKYEQVALSYPEFPISIEARKKADALKVKCDALLKTIMSALDAVGKGELKKARDIYRPLLELNQSLLVEQKVELPVSVTSLPSGSMIKLNGKEMGLTPRSIMIQAGEPFEITVERPGFSSKTVASDRLMPKELDISIRLDLDPVVIDLPQATTQSPAPLLAPPAWIDNHLWVLNGADLVALNPPRPDVLWTVPNLFDPKAPPPDNVSIDEKNYWLGRLAPTSYKPGYLLLPLRNKDLIEIDVRAPDRPTTRSLLSKIATLPAEITGSMYIEGHSKLAGKSLLIAAFADGMVRCFVDFDKASKVTEAKWTLPLDPQDAPHRDPPAAGLFGYKGLIWALSTSGCLQAFDAIESRAVYKQQYPAMSARSTFSTIPGDPLAAFIQRNGKVTIYDLEHRQDAWSLPPRQAMEESVGVTIDDTGVYVTARKDDYGELSKYSRAVDGTGGDAKPLSSVKLEGYVTFEMASGKHLYLVTHFNKIFAYSKNDLTKLWEYKMKPEQGEPKSIRAFGENVYVLTDKGKVIVLKAE